METVKDPRILNNPSCAVSWSAIFSGALVAFALSVLLNLFNAAIGLVGFPETFHTMAGISIGGYIWLIICAIVIMFIAGWVAGKVLRHYGGAACNGFLHGFLAWSLALIISLVIAAHFLHAGANMLNKLPDTRTEASTVVDNNHSRTEQMADVAGAVTFGVFFIFLLGAVASGVGGYVGAKSKTLAKY